MKLSKDVMQVLVTYRLNLHLYCIYVEMEKQARFEPVRQYEYKIIRDLHYEKGSSSRHA